MSWPGIAPVTPACEASTLEKSHPDSVDGYSEHLHMSPQHDTNWTWEGSTII
jgi:hypothetical protein